MIKDIPKDERPRERLIKYGVDNMSNEDLLSILIRTGRKGASAKDLSKELLRVLENKDILRNLDISMLTNIKGIGVVKAIELISALELGRRIYGNTHSEKLSIKDPRSIYEYFKYLIKEKHQEKFYCVYLDSKKNVINIKLLFVGTLNMSTVHPREIFKYAYLNSAAYIICVHNHPSGDVTPSNQDIDLTLSIKEIGLLQKIPILDHIIIGSENYYSFYENNYLE